MKVLEKKSINQRQRKVVAAEIISFAIIVITLMTITVLSRSTSNNKLIQSKDEDTNYALDKGGVVVNTSKSIAKDKTVQGIVLSENKIVYENGMSKLQSKVINDGNERANLKFSVKFISNDGSVIAESIGFVGDIKANETKYIDSYITLNVVNAKDVVYEVL